MIYDKQTLQFKNGCLLCFQDEQEAELCVQGMNAVVIDNYYVKFHPGKFRYQTVPVRPAAYSVITQQQLEIIQRHYPSIKIGCEQSFCVDSVNERQCIFTIKEAKAKVINTRDRFG